jgi:hypothetical protein
MSGCLSIVVDQTAKHGVTLGLVTDRAFTMGRPRSEPGNQPIRTTSEGWAAIVTEFVLEERFDTVNFLPELHDTEQVSRFASEVIPRVRAALSPTVSG